MHATAPSPQSLAPDLQCHDDEECATAEGSLDAETVLETHISSPFGLEIPNDESTSCPAEVDPPRHFSCAFWVRIEIVCIDAHGAQHDAKAVHAETHSCGPVGKFLLHSHTKEHEARDDEEFGNPNDLESGLRFETAVIAFH